MLDVARVLDGAMQAFTAERGPLPDGVLIQLTHDVREIEGVRVVDRPALGGTEIEMDVEDMPLAALEELIGKTKESPRLPGGPRRVFAQKLMAGRRIGFHASVRDGKVFALQFVLPRGPAVVSLTPRSRLVASLENGDRFEAWCHDADGAIDVVRYGAGDAFTKRTFTWNNQYMLFGAKLQHVAGDEFSLEVWGEHPKSCEPLNESYSFTREL